MTKRITCVIKYAQEIFFMNRNGFLFSLSALLDAVDCDSSFDSELFEENLDRTEYCSSLNWEDYTEDALWDRGFSLQSGFSA